MARVRALDDYYLAITFLITVAYQLFFFAIAYSLKFDKLTGTFHHCRAAPADYIYELLLTLK
jgi:hypothetical protein